jgi:hypothetical protein
MKNIKLSKQLTLDKLPVGTKEATISSITSKKQIIITEISTSTKVAEIALNIAFKLVPSNIAFSKIQFDLFFSNQQISSESIRILQGPLANEIFELTNVLNMKGIPAGSYILKIEMYELWSTGKRFSQATKEVTVDYVPQTREFKFIKVPSVKSVAGTSLSVISESEKTFTVKLKKQ